MSTLLDTHRAALEAYELETLSKPDLPVAVYLHEKDQLLSLVREPGVRDQMLGVGLPADFDQDFATRLATLREAQQAWWLGSSRRKPADQAAEELALRADIDEALDQLRWFGRKDRNLQAVVDRIADGTGIADLLADGDDTAALLDQHKSLFDTVTSFSPSSHASGLRDRTARVRAGQIGFRNDRSQNELVEARDRAFTWCDELASELQEAGRFAFRKDPSMKTRFGSAYVRSRSRRARNAKKAVQPPTDT